MVKDEKIDINVMYTCHSGKQVQHFENDKGRVWMHSARDRRMVNVGFGWYSLQKPKKPTDCIYVIEPRCVVKNDYDIRLVSKFNHIFTWAVKAFEGKVNPEKLVELNHPSCWKRTPTQEQLEKSWKSWDERKDEIVFIANNKKGQHVSELYTTRIALADYFHNHTHFEVSWYGHFNLSKPYYKGKIEEKHSVLNNAKFSICIENSYHKIYSHNYFTEKMPEVWFGGAVPVYMGCFNIDSFNLPKESYIDIRPFVNNLNMHGNEKPEIAMRALYRKLKNYTKEDYNKMRNGLFSTIKDPKGLYHIISTDRNHKKMIETILRDQKKGK